jgi:hypothetical protein
MVQIMKAKAAITQARVITTYTTKKKLINVKLTGMNDISRD